MSLVFECLQLLGEAECENSSRHAKEHAVALSMLSECAKCTDPTNKVECLVDNYYNGIHIKK